MAPRALPYTSLSIRFCLVRPLSGSTTPCACVSVDLPVRFSRAAPPRTAPPSKPVIEDLTTGVSTQTLSVWRILDPELREPFVSLGRLFLASGLTPIEGLLRFEVEKPTYDCTLGGIAPFYDVWVPLETARAVARDLGRLDELAGLLDWDSRKAWTVDDKEEGSLVHNWKIASDRIPPASYSTERMLSTSFPRINLLPSGSQVRTLLPPASSFPSQPSASTSDPSKTSTSYDFLWSRLMEWTTLEYETWLECPEPEATLDDARPPSGQSVRASEVREPERPRDLTPLFLFSTLVPLLSLSNALPVSAPARTASSSASTLTYLVGVELSRSELLPPASSGPRTGSSPADHGHGRGRPVVRGTLYLIDAISRLVLESWVNREGPKRFQAAERDERDQPGERGEKWRTGIEQRLEALERSDRSQDSSPSNRIETQASLTATVDELEARIKVLENALLTKDRIAKVETVDGRLQFASTAVAARSRRSSPSHEQQVKPPIGGTSNSLEPVAWMIVVVLLVAAVLLPFMPSGRLS
ncbi:hypothetical protein JCM10212_006411 [Sporobolomyces blumeae]